MNILTFLAVLLVPPQDDFANLVGALASPKDRPEAIRQLIALGERARPALKKGLASENPAVVSGAKEVLALLDERAAIVAKVGRREISRLELRLAGEVEKLKRPGEEIPPPVWFLYQLMETAAQQEILASFSRQPTPDEVREEIARIDRETKEPERWKAIKDLLEPYGSLLGNLVARDILVNQKIHALHESAKETHAGPRAAAEAAHAKAAADPGYLAAEGARNPGIYHVMDSLKDSASLEAFKLILSHVPKDDLPKVESGKLFPRVIDAGGGFMVIRVIERTEARTAFEMLRFRKRPFEEWYRGQLAGLEIEILDPALAKDFAELSKGSPLGDRLARPKPAK